MEDTFKFKHEADRIYLNKISPILLMIFSDLNIYCQKRKLPLVITRIVGDRIPGISKTDTHSEGRAIDISVKMWLESEIKDAEKYIKGKYVAKKGKHNKVFVFHNGTAWHIHLQVRRGLI